MSQSDDTQGLSPVRIDIPLEIRLYVIQLLQQTLACTVDLRSQLKQACWNVKGHDLVLLHALFATMATELDAHTDLVAERLVVLGGVARGTVRTAATHSRLPEYPGAHHGWRRPCAGADGVLRVLRHGPAGRHCVRDGGRGCGECGALHRHLAWSRSTAWVLGSVPPPRWGEHSINAPRWQSSSVSQWTSESVNAVERGHGREGLKVFTGSHALWLALSLMGGEGEATHGRSAHSDGRRLLQGDRYPLFASALCHARPLGRSLRSLQATAVAAGLPADRDGRLRALAGLYLDTMEDDPARSVLHNVAKLRPTTTRRSRCGATTTC